MTQDITSALQEQFLAQSRIFWHCNQASRFEELRQIAHRAMWRGLDWDWDELCISNLARRAAQLLDFVPSEVFAHPQALADTPELEEYYRLLACLSMSKFARIVSADGRQTPSVVSRFLNVVVSSRLEGLAMGSMRNLLYITVAERGTEWQPMAEG